MNLEELEYIFLDRDLTLIESDKSVSSVFDHSGWKFRENVKDRIKELKSHYELQFYMITNQTYLEKESDPNLYAHQVDVCEEVLSQLDLPKHNWFICDSKEISKPNASVLEALRRQFEIFWIDPKKCLMVGDAMTDFGFAKNTGMYFEWADKFFNFRPRIVVSSGIKGSGKTFNRRSYYPNFVPIDFDTDLSHTYPNMDKKMKKIYELTTFQIVENLLKTGQSVYIDGPHLTREDRAKWINLSQCLKDKGISNQVICQYYEHPVDEQGQLTVENLIEISNRNLHSADNKPTSLEIIVNQHNKFEPPALEEGFDQILISPWKKLETRDL